jgi:hypothetical protein
MNFELRPDEAAFLTEFRDFIRSHLPADIGCRLAGHAHVGAGADLANLNGSGARVPRKARSASQVSEPVW